MPRLYEAFSQRLEAWHEKRGPKTLGMSHPTCGKRRGISIASLTVLIFLTLLPVGNVVCGNPPWLSECSGEQDSRYTKFLSLPQLLSWGQEIYS